MNRKAKGDRGEAEVVEILTQRGFICHRTIAVRIHTKQGFFTQKHDIFGCIDILAKKKKEKTKWIQVSTASKKAQKERKLKQIPFNPKWEDVEIWIKTKKKKLWKIYRMNGKKKFKLVETIRKLDNKNSNKRRRVKK